LGVNRNRKGTAAYLRRLRLRNVKCFEDAELNFVDEDGSIIDWTVLLGKNGTGKLTVLRTIALLLAGEKAAEWLQAEAADMVRSGHDKGSAEAEIELTDSRGAPGETRVLNVGLDFADGRLSVNRRGPLAEDRKAFEEILSENYETAAFLCGYGATRVTLRGKPIQGRSYEKHEDARVDRLRTLFDELAPIPRLDDWLAKMEEEVSKAKDRGLSAEGVGFKRAAEVLAELLPSVTFKGVGAAGFAIFDTPYGEHPLAALSRGYRDTLIWVTDLMRRLLDAFPESDNPLHEKGIVLVEEIAQRLHPVLQQLVTEFLRGAFPNLQFIVTTHSALAAQSQDENELVLLERDAEGEERRGTVSIRRPALSPKGLSADQILTSPLFGLASAKSLEVQKKKEKFRQLRRKILTAEITAAERAEYESLRDQLNYLTEQPGETFAQSLQFMEMEDILRKLGRVDLLERPPPEKEAGKPPKPRRPRWGTKGFFGTALGIATAGVTALVAGAALTVAVLAITGAISFPWTEEPGPPPEGPSEPGEGPLARDVRVPWVVGKRVPVAQELLSKDFNVYTVWQPDAAEREIVIAVGERVPVAQELLSKDFNVLTVWQPDAAERGIVIAQSHKGKAPRGTTITITVSSGREGPAPDEEVPVPWVVGKRAPVAQKLLSENFNARTVWRPYADHRQLGPRRPGPERRGPGSLGSGDALPKRGEATT